MVVAMHVERVQLGTESNLPLGTESSLPPALSPLRVLRECQQAGPVVQAGLVRRVRDLELEGQGWVGGFERAADGPCQGAVD